MTSEKVPSSPSIHLAEKPSDSKDNNNDASFVEELENLSSERKALTSKLIRCAFCLWCVL